MKNDDEHLKLGERRLAEEPNEKPDARKTSTNYRRILDVCRAVKKAELHVSSIKIHPDGRIEVCPVVHDTGELSDGHSDDAERIARAFT